MSAYKVLIVDDEEDILDLLEYNLQKEDFMVFRASNGLQALERAGIVLPDVIILDIMMPVMDGVEACRKLRANPKLKNTQIIFLTARTEEYSELAGFEVGADDYVTKPVKPRVLISRLKAIVRRNTSTVVEEEGNVIRIMDLEIIKDEHVVRKEGVEYQLPRKEFDLLFFLASKPGKIFRREEVLENVWGDVCVVDRTVDVHIRKIREKLGEEYIQTVKGVGYKFSVK